MFQKYFSRFPHAFRGIAYALINDFGYRTQVYLGVALAVIISAIWQPLSMIEFLFIALSYALILITELQNSALEAALDRLHPELHDNIKISKDMAAGAVLTAGIFLGIVLVTIGLNRFF
jgi:undecaprenol kinase